VTALLAALTLLAALALPAVPGSTAASPAGAGAATGSLQDALRRLQADDVLVSDAAVEQIVAFGPAGADSLLALLTDSRRDVRAGAIRGLGLLRDARAAGPLREELRRSLAREEPDTFDDRYFRILTVQALGRIGDTESTDLLRTVVRRGDPFERAHGGISLFLLDEDPGYDVVRECLADTSAAVRSTIVRGLGDSTGPRARDLVLAATGDASWVVRDTAYRVLGGWPRDELIRGALEAGAADPSWFVRQTVDEARRGPLSANTEKGER
jgi:HEAT repeat protein